MKFLIFDCYCPKVQNRSIVHQKWYKQIHRVQTNRKIIPIFTFLLLIFLAVFFKMAHFLIVWKGITSRMDLLK